MSAREIKFLGVTLVLCALTGFGFPWNIPLCAWAGMLAAAALDARA